MPTIGNLAAIPWIPVLDVNGKAATAGLTDLFDAADGLAAAAVGGSDQDALAQPATMRLLQAIHQAAAAEGVSPHQWIIDNQTRFELFDRDQPFAQCGDLWRHVDALARPAGILPLFNAGDGPTLLNHQYTAAEVAYSPAEAARLLLIRQAFGPGGIQPFPAAPYGADAKNGKASVAGVRPYLWVQAATVADSLAASTVPGPTGDFLFSWPAGRLPGQGYTPTGQVSALTWPSKAALLIPDGDGMVRRAAYGNGLVFGEATDPNLLPHTVFRPGAAAADPVAAARVSLGRSAGRDVLTAWVTPAAQVGLLGHLRSLPASRRDGWTLRWQGLASYQSRLDGVLDWSMPVPTAGDAAIIGFLDAVTVAAKSVFGRLKSAAGHAHPGDNTLPKRLTGPADLLFTATVERLAAAVAVGGVSAVDTAAELNEASAGALASARDHFTAHSPQSLLALEVPTP